MGLQTAIHRYIAEHNTAPKPFVWTADPDRVLAAIKRGGKAEGASLRGCGQGNPDTHEAASDPPLGGDLFIQEKPRGERPNHKDQSRGRDHNAQVDV